MKCLLFAASRFATIRVSKSFRLLTRCLPGPIWASVKNRDVPDFVGAPDTIRTCDLCLRRDNAAGRYGLDPSIRRDTVGKLSRIKLRLPKRGATAAMLMCLPVRLD